MPEHGNSEDPKPNTTFAIRLYEGYTSKGLAVPFMRETEAEYMTMLLKNAQLDDFTGVWLETDTDNKAARKTYENVGYEYVHQGEDRVLMALGASALIQDLNRQTVLETL